jgi:iron complex outermembrane receptor protein
VARAFRVPTFTERYYSDPAHQARPGIQPETAWAGEAGADLFLAGGWSARATVFGRLEHDVIDWLRPTTADRWQTYNIHDVDAVGIELGVSRTLGPTAFVQLEYTGLDVRAASVAQLSKYVLDLTPHAVTLAGVLPLPADMRVAPRLEYKRRSRSTGTSDYTLIDVRLSRAFGPVRVFVEGTNLLDASYQEVLNVAMPGRAASVGLTVTP